MKRLSAFWKSNKRAMVLVLVSVLTVVNLLIYKLGNLNNGGLSHGEWLVSKATGGWHGIYQDPLYLPMSVVRSSVNLLASHHSQFITRLPSVIIGVITIIIFASLIRLWHGTRTAILGTLMFATSAWVLHVSRLASYDVVYLMVIPALLLSVAILQRYANKPLVLYGSMLIWGILIYVPGVIWLVALTIFWERKSIRRGWKQLANARNRILYVLAGLIWLPLLALKLKGLEKVWLGIPEHIGSLSSLITNFGNVFYHLLIHGPIDATIWLSNAPLLDVFTLIMLVMGVYFYIKHWRVGRARILLSYLILGTIIISLGGPVSLSLLVPLLYICAATGIAYLIHEWLQVFPFNPFARIIGISLVVLVISMSCVYNLRSYFVAWPHNSLTQSTFTTR